MKLSVFLGLTLFVSLTSCQLQSNLQPDTPQTVNSAQKVEPFKTAPLVNDLPTLWKSPNQIEIDMNYVNMDPSLVLGAVIDIKTHGIKSLDNVLTEKARPTVKPLDEVIFDNLVDNAQINSVGYLNFLKGQVSDSTYVNVTILRSFKGGITLPDIDTKKVADISAKLGADKIGEFAIVIGYIDNLISGALLKESGQNIGASGFGISINGKWYSKFSNTNTYHRVVAIISPFPVIANVTQAKSSSNKDLESVTNQAIGNQPVVKDLNRPLHFEFGSHPFGS